MRIFVKGGVWKNTEDEILKAAVMKYGKQNWARVASLLSRKNAAQCKSRWYEWLDPSIKKTDWDREEDEKLLHLAKIMPTQWRTIAPIVGRTASQCLERYEYLIDKAQQQAGVEDAAVGGALDPRRLRAGEIDPNPESRPARPDPVDMDDDEKEMLSEARARLANTQGKKAKRKAREKQLQEAKRLASLQKKRELKEAGIWGGPKKKRRKNQVDYNAEIPFEKLAPKGKFDITAEKERESMERDNNKEFTMVQINKLEAQRRDQEEAKAKSKDKKKFQKLQKMNLTLSVSMLNDRNDPSSFRKRSKLSMPAPTITNDELTEIVKASSKGVGISNGIGATSSLMGTYDATPSVSSDPIRTPLASHTLMNEALNHLAYMNNKTPLLGGENKELHGNGTGFSGATPNVHKLATPNLLAEMTPSRTPMNGGATPSGSVMGTPMRDELGLNANNGITALINVDPRMEAKRRKETAAAIRRGFSSLPEPQYEYAVAIPEVEDVESSRMEVEEDASERDDRIAAIAAAELALELKRRSTVLKRELPRPIAVNKSGITDDDDSNPAVLIHNEQTRLLVHDGIKYPMKVSKKKKTFTLEDISLADIEHAKSLLNSELQTITDACEMSRGGYITLEEWESGWEEANADVTLLGESYRLTSSLNASELTKAKSQEFKSLKQILEKEATRSKKLEQKTAILVGGYAKKSNDIRNEMEAASIDIKNLSIELDCYKLLHKMEKNALPFRTNILADEVAKEEQREKTLQNRYSKLMEAKLTLETLLRA